MSNNTGPGRGDRAATASLDLVFTGVDTHSGTAEVKALEHLAQRLRHDYGLPAETVDSAIAEASAKFAGRPIRDFIPILVEREVKDRLAASSTPETPADA